MSTQPNTLTAKTPRSTKPTVVKTQVITLRAQGKTISDIARELSLDWHTVERICKEAKLPDIESQSVEKTLAKVGITRETVASKLKELMEANETKRATFEGKFTDSAVDPDNSTRFRATELTAKVLEMLPREDTAAIAQLFVRLPDGVLTAGHPSTCTCATCCQTWDALPIESSEPER